MAQFDGASFGTEMWVPSHAISDSKDNSDGAKLASGGLSLIQHPSPLKQSSTCPSSSIIIFAVHSTASISCLRSRLVATPPLSVGQYPRSGSISQQYGHLAAMPRVTVVPSVSERRRLLRLII